MSKSHKGRYENQRTQTGGIHQAVSEGGDSLVEAACLFDPRAQHPKSPETPAIIAAARKAKRVFPQHDVNIRSPERLT